MNAFIWSIFKHAFVPDPFFGGIEIFQHLFYKVQALQIKVGV